MTDHLANAVEPEIQWRPTSKVARRLFSSGEIEKMLAIEAASRLSVSPESLDANVPLTHYGIDSLAAIEIAHNLVNKCGVEVSFEMLIGGLKISEIASEIARLAAAGRQHTSEGENYDPKGTAYSGDWGLSSGQEAIWFLHRQMPLSSAYNVIAGVRFRSPVNGNRLQRCLQTIVSRHSALRATFTQVEGRPIQRIAEYGNLFFDRRESLDWDESQFKEQLAAEARRPFDLERGPLLRAHLWTWNANNQVLLIVVHHIVVDLWSLSMMLKELLTLYEDELRGRSTTLKRAVQYAAYVEWQRKMLESQQGDAHWNYWQNQLRGHLPRLDMHTDRPRPEVQTYRGNNECDMWDAGTTDNLRRFSATWGVTLNMVLLAIYQTLLYRYTGREEFVVGAVMMGRNRAEWANVFGYFVNSVPLVAKLQGACGFTELLRQVQETVIGAFEHQEYPLSRLVERLQPARIPGRAALFDTLFVFQQSPFSQIPELTAFALGLGGTEVELSGIQLESIAIEHESTTFDLTLMVGDLGGRIGISMKYSTDLFDPSTIRRLLGHFRTLTSAIVQGPTQPISSLGLLTGSERQMLITDWNPSVSGQTESEITCVSGLFERQANATPSALAVTSEDQQLTYGELNDRASKVGNYLESLGVAEDVPVAVCMNRSSEMIIAIFGIMKAGGAYVPLDPAEPDARLTSMLHIAGKPLLLTQRSLMERFAKSDAVKQCIDIDRCLKVAPGRGRVRDRSARNSAAYIVFTSGSTGSPRGVCVERGQLLHYVRVITEKIQVPAGSSFATLSTIAADLGNTMIFPALCTGGCLHILSSDRSLSPRSLSQYFVEHGIDCLKIVPSHLEMLLKANSVNVLPRRRLVLGGETCAWSLIARIQSLAPTCTLINHYGPTETTVGVLVCDLDGDKVGVGSANVPIGRPLSEVQAYVLDQHLQPVPIGVTGELYIGGTSVTRGYYDLPAATAARFMPDPFSQKAGSRFYKTGDMACYRTDGMVEFLGRADDQIKIRGYRVELGEIESVLKQHSSVRQIAVLAKDMAAVGKQLIAYVVAAPEKPTDAHELRQFANQRLPDHMVPSSFVLLEVLPLTPNGKVNRTALAAMNGHGFSADNSFDLPLSPIEQALAALWGRLLGVEKVGIKDNFFELGGHSLLATQLTSRLEEIFPCESPLLVSFFQDPTVRGLTEAILQEQGRTEEIEKAAALIDDLSLCWQA